MKKVYKIFDINWEVGHIRIPKSYLNGKLVDLDLEFNTEDEALKYIERSWLDYSITFTVLPIWKKLTP